MIDFHHIPVLAQETLAQLNPQRGGRYIDCTLGGGGHSSLILESSEQVKLLSLDCDENAIAAASSRLEKFAGRSEIRRMNFRDLKQLSKDDQWNEVDGILMDIGVSSHHLDVSGRGFTFREDGPLDMRMDRRLKMTAAQLLNTVEEEELARIFFQYGELRESRRLARAIVRRREEKLFSRTQELRDVIESVMKFRRGGPPAATLPFQALRIAVNGELDALEQGMKAAFSLLKKGGRLAIITFHSLEDRMVKRYFRKLEGECICPPGMPVCSCGCKQEGRILTKKPVTAGSQEKKDNSRAACAKLRAIEKI